MELRWLQLHADDLGSSHPFAIRHPDTPYFFVLQLREREGPRGEGWWGEWQDIPVHGPGVR